MHKKSLAFALTALLCSHAHAELSHSDSVNAGKTKTASCVSCHGEHGNSTMPMFPKLAGQNSAYIANQLKAFKSGERKDPMMATLAMTLTENDIVDIANYYADQKVTGEHEELFDTAEEKAEHEAMVKLGGDLYRNGDLKREVSACIACHSPHGEGNKPAGFPALKAQHANYLVKALTDFQTGKRANHPENIMHMIAGKMTDAEIKAVATRIATMKPEK
ncbi:MAG: c-type cytochrome [Methylococcales bacterium]|nr:c-type cytochrome [Methylococcales bacterium]